MAVRYRRQRQPLVSDIPVAVDENAAQAAAGDVDHGLRGGHRRGGTAPGASASKVMSLRLVTPLPSLEIHRKSVQPGSPRSKHASLCPTAHFCLIRGEPG
jgi:hypothetical protein